jgi:hypothetical protein
VTPIEDVLLWSLAQEGDRYIFGWEIAPGTQDPKASDCSELVEWACGMAGVQPTVPDGSWIQYRHCRDRGQLLRIDEAVNTRGALLFRFVGNPDSGGRPSSAHVAWSLGDGTTIEARGTKWGVGTWSAYGRGWTHAGLLPGIDYGPNDHIIHEEDDMANVTGDELAALLRGSADAGQAKNEAGAAKVEAAAAKDAAHQALAKVGSVEKSIAGLRADVRKASEDDASRDWRYGRMLQDVVAHGADRSAMRPETVRWLERLDQGEG